jgi:hypothetical protein
MLEIIAGFIDESDKCQVTFSLTRWGRQTNITSKKFLFLSQCCADVGLMSVQRVDDDITIKIPNLLKHRDNHTRNLQVTSKQELDIYKEDKDKEKKDKRTPSADSHPEKKKQKPIKIPLPENFAISDAVRAWYLQKGYRERIEDHLTAFIDAAMAKGYVYIDWDAAFRNAIAKDWAELRSGRNQQNSGNMARFPVQDRDRQSGYKVVR